MRDLRLSLHEPQRYRLTLHTPGCIRRTRPKGIRYGTFFYGVWTNFLEARPPTIIAVRQDHGERIGEEPPLTKALDKGTLGSYIS